MSTQDEIKKVEERLDKRRELIALRLDDVKHEIASVASRTARSWPVFAIAGGLAAGYAISRGGRHRAPEPSVRYVPVRNATDESHARAKGVLAGIVGLAATAIRIGASSEARVLYNAFKGFRERRRPRG